MTTLRNALLLAAAALAAPSALQASIPPSYKVLVVSADREHEAASRALVEAMSALGAFARATPDVYRSDVAACLDKGDAMAACVRAAVAARPVNRREPPVVIVAEPVDGHRSRWRCLGSGAAPAQDYPGEASVDLRAAIFGDEPARTDNRRAAMQCIYAAASESRAQ